MTPIVSIIVVNYNGEEHISDCVAALCKDHQSPPSEKFVVDNASTDNSREVLAALEERYPDLNVIHSPENRGYAGGVNLALTHSQGEFIAILNMDTIVTPGWLDSPVSFLEANPQAGAVSPLLVLDQDENLINAIGQSVHVTGLGFNRGLMQERSSLGTEPIRVSGIHGGAFIIRKSILDACGGLDESGFLYHEDVDISWLLLLMGYDLYCLPNSIVQHKYFLTMYPQKLYLLERNRVAMLFAHLQLLGLVLLTPFLFCTELMMWGYCLLRGRSFLRAKLFSYQWVKDAWDNIQRRKKYVNSLRKIGDWSVLNKLAWGYSWDQFLTLSRERGLSERQPTGGLPLGFEKYRGISQD